VSESVSDFVAVALGGLVPQFVAMDPIGAVPMGLWRNFRDPGL
jgi:hypothetical protein